MFSRLFGKKETVSEPDLHEGFAITPAPLKEAGGWRVAATIETDGKSHQLIRADVLQDRTEADAASLRKAKQIIDQQGMRLFD